MQKGERATFYEDIFIYEYLKILEEAIPTHARR